MTSCDVMEIAVSALIDGELSRNDHRRALDHLVECPACREFYRRSRLLSRAARRAAPEPDEEPPGSELWQRISDSSFGRGKSTQGPSMWWWRVAAGLLLLVGFSMLLPTISSRQGLAGDKVLELTLEGERGQMSEARFVALTAELLKADRRYHRKMLEVMLAVDEAVQGREGSPEDSPGWREENKDRAGSDDESPPSEPRRPRRSEEPHHV